MVILPLILFGKILVWYSLLSRQKCVRFAFIITSPLFAKSYTVLAILALFLMALIPVILILLRTSPC